MACYPKDGACNAFSDYLSLFVIRPFLIRSGTKPGGATGQSSAPFDAHAQLRIVDHDRASINRTSTNSANRHVAMIGTYGETIPVEGFMDRCFLMRPSRSWTRANDIGRRDYRGQDHMA